MTLQDILSRLRNVKQTANGYTAQCPTHHDSKNSLSLTETSGKILLNCFAGCSANDICTALEIKVSDLFVSTNGKPKKKEIKRELVCAYDYQDQDGESLYQNVKEKVTYTDGSTDKDYYARRFDKEGKEIRNLDGVLRVPYGLPALIKLPANYAFITAEGEKDADKLKENGLIATNHKNWKPEFNYLLKDKDVVIFADHDKPGIELAKKTAQMIFRDAKAVKIVDCFEGEPIPEKHGRDVSDWLELGHTKDELLKVIQDTQNFELSEDEKPKPEKVSQANQILQLAEDIELFHTSDRTAFASIEVGDHTEVHPVHSKGFRDYLSYQFYQTDGKSPSSQALQDAVNSLSGKAKFEGKTQDVHIRLASFNGKIYLDLCNDEWQIVEIDADGCRVIEASEAPVRFKRTKAMLPLPIPNRRGDISKLRNFLNVDEKNFILILAWLVNSFRPDYPFPILNISGEQGTAKTTATKVCREIVDPSLAPFRSAPRDERDLVIAAVNAWVCAFDNLSSVSNALSDGFCRISTGGSLATRTLYSDDEETIFTAKRPIILNGIGDIASRSDLLDRALLIKLEAIPKDKRKPEREFWAEFEKERTSIFSALISAVSSALKNIETTTLSELPRMADFALWATAAEQSLGLEKDAFMKAYTQNREDAHSIVLEDSILAEILQEFCAASAEGGKYSRQNVLLKDLLGELKEKAGTERSADKKFPKSPKGLRNALERINPNLREIGIFITFHGRSGGNANKGASLSLEYDCNQTSQTSVTSQSPQNKAETSDVTCDVTENVEMSNITKSSNVTNPASNITSGKANNNNGLASKSDVSDVSDVVLHTYSDMPKCHNCKLEMTEMLDKSSYFCPIGCRSEAATV